MFSLPFVWGSRVHLPLFLGSLWYLYFMFEVPFGLSYGSSFGCSLILLTVDVLYIYVRTSHRMTIDFSASSHPSIWILIGVVCILAIVSRYHQQQQEVMDTKSNHMAPFLRLLCLLLSTIKRHTICLCTIGIGEWCTIIGIGGIFYE